MHDQSSLPHSRFRQQSRNVLLHKAVFQHLTWKRHIVYPPGTENPNETSYQNNLSPSQTADAEAALYDQRCSHVMTDYSVIMKLSYRQNLAHTAHMVGWERLYNKTSWNNRMDAQVPSLSQPNTWPIGERERKSVRTEHQKPTPLNKSVE